MKSIGFPKMFSGSKTATNIITDSKATSNNLGLLVASSKGELLGDPYYGTSIKQFMFDPNDVILRDLCADDLYTSIRVFIPQVVALRKDIDVYNVDWGKVVANIKATNQADFSIERFNLVLLQGEE